MCPAHYTGGMHYGNADSASWQILLLCRSCIFSHEWQQYLYWQQLTFKILVLALSPAKKTTKTAFSCFSPEVGSSTLPTAVDLRNMFPRVALNRSLSKGISFSCWMTPATKPRRTVLGSVVLSPASKGASIVPVVPKKHSAWPEHVATRTQYDISGPAQLHRTTLTQ